MTKLGDLFLIPEWSDADRDVVAKALNRLESIAHDLGAHIGPEGVVSDLKAGAVRINAAGLKAFSTGLETIRLDADGDAFFGSNLSAPGTTSFVIFSNAQTYNSESMGAADVLLGDNSSGKANILWDKSAGKILFRGGTTEQGSIDTTGAAIFGGGEVTLDATGVTLVQGEASVNKIKWTLQEAGKLGTELYGSNAQAAIARFDIKVGGGTSAPGTDILGVVGISASNAGTWGDAQSTFGLQPDNVDSIGFQYKPNGGASRRVFNFTNALEFVFNEGQNDHDFRIESDTKANAVLLDAGLHAFQLGGATVSDVAGDIADFRAATIVFNEGSNDIDFRIESNTYANMFIVDAGADQVQVGTATAGAIATLDNSGIVFNEDSQDRDLRVESNGDANALFVDGGTDRVGIGTNAPALKLHVVSPTAADSYFLIETTAASAAATGPGFFAQQNDGAALGSGHQLGSFGFQAHDGVGAGKTGAVVIAWGDGLWSGTDHRTSLAFYTVPASSVTLTEALRIQNDQTLKLSSANSWTANGTGTVTISNLAPAGVGTATISKWLTVTDNAGGVLYIPAWT